MRGIALAFLTRGQRNCGAARKHPHIFLFARVLPALRLTGWRARGCPSAISRDPVASVPQSPRPPPSFDTPDKTPRTPLLQLVVPSFPPPTLRPLRRKPRAPPIEEAQSMALSCMRCPAGAAARRAAAPPPSPMAAVSFARCGFWRSTAAAGCWRIQAVAPQGGVCPLLLA